MTKTVTRSGRLPRKPHGKDHVLPGQLVLFGVVCPACGQAQGEVMFVGGKRRVICTMCGGEAVEVVSCGCYGR
jgi:hypothetical protein